MLELFGKALFATLDCISFSLTALQFCFTLNHRRFSDRQSLRARTAPAIKKHPSSWQPKKKVPIDCHDWSRAAMDPKYDMAGIDEIVIYNMW